jgi:hypothetical protein
MQLRVFVLLLMDSDEKRGKSEMVMQMHNCGQSCERGDDVVPICYLWDFSLVFRLYFLTYLVICTVLQIQEAIYHQKPVPQLLAIYPGLLWQKQPRTSLKRLLYVRGRV